MALGQYHTASIDLQASIKAIHLPPLIPQDTRAMLIKRVFRLVRCYLAVLDAPNASQTLNTLSSDYLDVQKILPGDSNYNDFLILSSRIKFLLELKDKMDLARSVQNWQSALRLIATFEREILTWGLKFNLSHLPGSWTLCKAEMLARTGKPVEAERMLALFVFFIFFLDQMFSLLIHVAQPQLIPPHANFLIFTLAESSPPLHLNVSMYSTKL